MLASFRVLDLSDERTQLCGQILAFLGAEVILIEPPGGSPARRVGPFARRGGDAQSLHFWSYNRGKRSAELDVGSPADRETLKELIAGADVLVESFDPGAMAAWGLGPDELAALNPALVSVSISAFGGDGPKANWKATDLTVVAAGGQLCLTGDEDRAPVRVSVAQAFHHAAADAAGAVMLALHERQNLSGLGQHVDVSAQQSITQATQSMMLAAPLEASLLTRVAGGVKVGPIHVQLMWPCADGFVSVTLLFGSAIGPFTKNLVDWAFEEGFCDEVTRDLDWINFTAVLFSDPSALSIYEALKSMVGRFLATKTKAELLDAAFERRLLIAPVTTTADVVASPQLQARDFWEAVDHGPYGMVRYPGALAKLTATPLPALGAAPSVGADRDAVLGGGRRRPNVPAALGNGGGGHAGPRTGGALHGLKVLDLMWVMAGPACSRVMADYGATVVRVESANRVDTARTIQPFRGDGNNPDDSGLFNNMNAGKLGLALDLSKPGSRDVILDLVRWADVVMEAFSPRAMTGWGLGYDTLAEVNPGVIMVSTCLMGQSGPWASLAGFGTMASAISGFFNVTGWPDRPPCGPFGAYTDYVAPKLLLPVVLAALEHRRVSGQGQYIDMAQGEAALQFLAPALLDQVINGHVAERRGNDDAVFVPHGVYPAAGEDRWVAISVTDDVAWTALCGLIGRSDLAALDNPQRRQRSDELDGLVAAWTSTVDMGEAQERLQAAGVAAHQVQNSPECLADPQLTHRHHFRTVEHGAQGTTVIEGTRYQLSRTPAVVTAGGPTVGQHTFDVLSDLLGYDADRIAELAIAEALE